MTNKCSMDGCAKTIRARSFCITHYTRWRKHGDPNRVDERSGRPIAGEFPTWHAIHKRLTRTRGSARKYRCTDCHAQASEWSYDGRDTKELASVVQKSVLKYSLSLEHYDPRCTRCHRIFDRSWVVRSRDEQGRFSAPTTHE